jgi:hypothetical protein
MSARYPNKFVVWSAIFILLGLVLLLWTLGAVPGLASLWPLVPLIAGLAFLYWGMLRWGSESYILVGMILALGGFFVLLSNTVLSAVTLYRTWPIFMAIVGVSLLVYALRTTGESRLSLSVPAVGLVVLAAVFLPFSMDLVSADFGRVVASWWPVLLIFFGIVLLIVHFVRR